MKAHPIPDAALESDIAILGKKGRGKSYTARGIAERLLAMGRRVVVLDPLSTWYGLAAGRQAFPIAVLGGPHGDLPLKDADGAALGRFLATAHQSAVLDLGQMRKAEMVRFAVPFLEELYTHNRDPLWLVLEEADVFAPQNPAGDQARLYGEVDRIARRGRNFGFRLITLTQRPARIAKDVLSMLSTLVALGITSPQDRDAIKAWVDGNADRDQAKSVVDSLASLKVGEGWVWAPDLSLLERVTFPKNKTPDTSATPIAGERRPDAKVTARVDVAALKAALVSHESGEGDRQAGSARTSGTQTAAALAAAEARIAELERGAGHNQLATDAAALTAADAAGYARGRDEALASVKSRMFDALAMCGRLQDALEAAVSPFSDAEPGRPKSQKSGKPESRKSASKDRPAKRDADPAGKRQVGATGLVPARQKILDAIAWMVGTGQDEPSRQVVAFLARVSWKSSGYRNNLSALHTEGLIRYPSRGLLALTKAGRDLAQAPTEALDHATMMARINAVLAPARMRVLEAVLTAYPEAAARDDIAVTAGVSPASSGFRNNLSGLSSLGLVTYPASGLVRAADLLFPETGR